MNEPTSNPYATPEAALFDSRLQWRGMNLRVDARLLPERLWGVTRLDIFLGNELIVSTGAPFWPSGKTSAEFQYAGAQHHAELSWRTTGVMRVPYRLHIDGMLVLDTHALVENWPMQFMTWLFMIFGVWLVTEGMYRLAGV